MNPIKLLTFSGLSLKRKLKFLRSQNMMKIVIKLK